ncbi:MAG: VanW family protein [Ardenticatenaceae bacterium]|nr:VanW family protein [Ardenticatenaceae bacterium]
MASFGRKLGFFLIVPLTTFVVVVLATAVIVANYQSQHNGRIYTGVNVWGVDLSQMTPAEAEQALLAALPYAREETITFTDPQSSQTWVRTSQDLGMMFDMATTVNNAMLVGRQGVQTARLREIFEVWYYGRSLAPILIFDEGKLDTVLGELAADINQPATNANLQLNGSQVNYTPARFGKQLDMADVYTRLKTPVADFRSAEIELLVHETLPAIHDTAESTQELQQTLSGDVTFYLETPLDEMDLMQVVLPQATLQSWLRIELAAADDGRLQHQTHLDENAARQWLEPFMDQLYREPVNARFYFDDDSRELVLVSPHINGRSLNIEATIDNLKQTLATPDRTVAFAVQDIVPVVHSGATAADLGITELVSERTTWFYGSTDARKHNIARSAANFFGIVIAPGEEFSFNKYLGSVSESDGYEEGLIIIGGRTIKGVGGGVCQVSTTIYQTAFWAGFPIEERYPHGYMLGYYNDGEGPGMDATVFSPVVDLKFINNTPYHLLIENYYNTELEALTFKFYSTSLGRQVFKEELPWENIVEAPTEDEWEYDPDLPEGEAVQIDWETDGADVTIHRTVLNANGDLLIDQYIVSNYIPYPDVYHYGPGVEPFDYSAVTNKE